MLLLFPFVLSHLQGLLVGVERGLHVHSVFQDLLFLLLLFLNGDGLVVDFASLLLFCPFLLFLLLPMDNEFLKSLLLELLALRVHLPHVHEASVVHSLLLLQDARVFYHHSLFRHQAVQVLQLHLLHCLLHMISFFLSHRLLEVVLCHLYV